MENLPLKLKGHAVDYSDGLTQEQRATFDLLVKNLKARFPTTVLSESVLDKRVCRTQMENESVDSFASAILEISSRLVDFERESQLKIAQSYSFGICDQF